jgi:hypothetical protein
MYDEDRPIGIPEKQHLDKPVADPTTLDEPFLIARLPWKTMSSMIYDVLNFFHCAAMLGGVFEIPITPTERFHELYPTKL